MKVSSDLSKFELLSKAMIVKLAENDIILDGTDLTTDDLVIIEIKEIRI